MNGQMAVGLAIAAGIALVGAATAVAQVRGLRTLAARRHVPSDEFAYLRSRHRRRLATAGIMLLIAGLIAGAFLSGMEARADALGEPKDTADTAPAAKKPEMTPEERQFVRFWGVYWIGVLVLGFGLVAMAVADFRANRSYWAAQYRTLRSEHEEKLRRDLAVHRAQRSGRRGGRIGGGRFGSDEDAGNE